MQLHKPFVVLLHLAVFLNVTLEEVILPFLTCILNVDFRIIADGLVLALLCVYFFKSRESTPAMHLVLH